MDMDKPVCRRGFAGSRNRAPAIAKRLLRFSRLAMIAHPASAS